MKTNNKIKLLDCTLRDGGYYNNWNFSNDLVENYIKNINESNIDVVEVGFRFLKENTFGNFGNTKENLLKKLKFKKNLKLGIMINSADFNSYQNYKSLINKYFLKKDLSKISLIRLATHLKDMKSILPKIKYLKKLGYKIGVNLMQIDKVKKGELIKVLKLLKSTNSVDVFYFADSFGNLNSKNVKKICRIIKGNWSKEFGFHAHDNCGLALQNCITALENGARWVDSTIQGMGRGAGNVTTEDLICYLNEKIPGKYNPKPIYYLAESVFKNLKMKHGWGKSIYYHLSAKNNIHPSYIQEILVDSRYNHNEIIDMIMELSKIKASSFNPITLKDLINEKINLKNNWNAKNWCLNRNVLIVGQGASVRKNREKIIKFVKTKKCRVLALNINTMLENKIIDYYVACHEARIMVDFKKYKNIGKKLILPLDRFKNILKQKISKKIKNYGMIIKKNSFKSYNKYCELPKNLALGYALSISMAGRAKGIYLAGFDGYKKQRMLNIEMNDYLKFIREKIPNLKLINITPSNYKFIRK